MRFPLKWLKEYVKINISTDELVALLPQRGFEVEEVIIESEGLSGVSVGKIVDIEQHPNADKLRVCRVSFGKDESTIVTNSGTVSKGDLVPVARPGARLAGGMEIGIADLRGVTSYGMFCGLSELGITLDHIPYADPKGVIILREGKAGDCIKKVLGLDDTILDISIPSNRGDCYSVYGMAREIAVSLNTKLVPLDLSYNTGAAGVKTGVAIDDDNCTRYMGAGVSDITVAPSPSLIRHRLRQVGVRSINNIVDITNYVLHEVGQPLHAFDVGKLSGDIVVRSSYDGEVIKALDCNDYKLPRGTTVISDSIRGLAIAGIMGGEYSGVTEETREIFLESARFGKGSIRSASRKLGLRSTSSGRFEKGLDFVSVEVGLRRALALISKLRAGKPMAGIVDTKSIPTPKPRVIKTNAKEIGDLLGIKVSPNKITKTLGALGLEVSASGERLVCKVPLWREDIDNYTDLAEEIIRHIGYDKIESTFLSTVSVTQGGRTEYSKFVSNLKNIAVAHGLYEAITYSFVRAGAAKSIGIEGEEIVISNPLSSDYAVMRIETVSRLLESVRLNQKRGNDKVRLFEVGRVYLGGSDKSRLPVERDVLTIAMAGAGAEFGAIKGIAEDITAFCKIDSGLDYSKLAYLHGGISVDMEDGSGSYGRVHPKIEEDYEISNCYVAVFDIEALYERYCNKTVKYKPLSKYPGTSRDLAVTVADAVSHRMVVDAITRSGGEYLSGVELFDVYKGVQVEAGYKSMAYRLSFVSSERTFVDTEIDEAMKNVLVEISDSVGAKLRV